MIIPSIASDLETISKKDLQFGIYSLFSYKKKDNLKNKFGLYANTEKFGRFFVQIVGLFYMNPNQKLVANLNLPINFDVNCKLLNMA